MIRWSCLAFLSLCLLAATVAGASDDFRCDTEIFVGDDEAPVQETLTIFTGSLAYDFRLSMPEEVTVYDFGRGEVKLLDKGRKVRTTIAADDLLRVAAAYKTAKPKSELFAFCRQPSFTETFADDVLLLEAKPLSYRALCTKPGAAKADKRYRDFADWSARLNAMRPGKNLPPFPRMELNKALAARGMLPSEIERTIVISNLTGKRTEVVRSRHLFNWALSTQDRRRIDEVGDYLNDFASVPAGEYLELDKTAAKTAAR